MYVWYGRQKIKRSDEQASWAGVAILGHGIDQLHEALHRCIAVMSCWTREPPLAGGDVHNIRLDKMQASSEAGSLAINSVALLADVLRPSALSGAGNSLVLYGVKTACGRASGRVSNPGTARCGWLATTQGAAQRSIASQG